MISGKAVLPLLLSLVLSCALTEGQSYFPDTIWVDTKKDDSLTFRNSLHIRDYRNTNPHFISLYEKKKFLFFPVDQIVNTRQPVADILMDYQNKASDHNYLLNIHEFYINHSSSLFKRNYRLNGTLELFETGDRDTSLIGTFYYEQAIQKSKKPADSISFSEAFDFYAHQIVGDLDAVCSDTTVINKQGDYHFRSGVRAAPKNLYITSDVYVGFGSLGSGFWGFDAEVYFSDPEPSDRFSRKSHMFRYLDMGNRESVAITRRIHLLNYRLSDQWLFQNKYAFLLGFNKWHDIDEAKRKLEEIFLLQLTASQRIYHNTLDSRGFIFGVGFMEETSYIIYNKPMLNIGILVSCGYKF